MTTHALAMPDYVAALITLSINRMGLETITGEDDVISAPITYQGGTELSIVVMCIAQRGWFRVKPVLLVSLAQLDKNTRAVAVHFKDTLAYPTGPHDVPFMINLATKVRSMAWALAVTGGMGECMNLPGRPPTPKGL